jgi:hypothetical protein
MRAIGFARLFFDFVPLIIFGEEYRFLSGHLLLPLFQILITKLAVPSGVRNIKLESLKQMVYRVRLIQDTVQKHSSYV